MRFDSRVRQVSHVLICALVLFCGTMCSRKAEPKVTRIGVTQIASHPGIDAIRQGFLEEMRRGGFGEAQGCIFEQSNAQGDMAVAQTIAQNLASSKCDLIFAISTPSSQAVAQAIKGTRIPLVFGAVTDPVAAGLVENMQKPGNNITGTSDQWPVGEQVALLLRVVPTVRRLGVVFNPGETNAASNVAVLDSVCRGAGLVLVRVSVSGSSEVQQAAQSLVGRCDALYVPADNTVIAAMDAMVKVSERYKLPLLPGVSSGIEQGGFATEGPDYHDIGIESAKLAVRILKGESASTIPVATAKRFELLVNMRSAKASGVVLPEDLVKSATKVFE